MADRRVSQVGGPTKYEIVVRGELGERFASAFGGMTVSGTFYATAIGICMLIGRYWVIVPVMAIAGSLARKKSVAVTSGTLPTHGPLFVALLVFTILLVGALTFIPSLAFGPIVEHLMLAAGGAAP